MAFVGDLFKYTPTGAFSFAIHPRNPLTGKASPIPVYESFFLLPPESYSMKEGYKVTVNKTINGAWVDDFGNDVKKISLKGSLYSYYFGVPATKFGGVFNNLIKTGRDILPPAAFGHSALD